MKLFWPDPLAYLIKEKPEWAEVLSNRGTYFDVRAAPTRASGRPTRAYILTIAISKDSVFASERVGRRILPGFCPQRHINDDGSFCIGLTAESSVVDEKSAVAWWAKLQAFLLCQETAHRTRDWPIENQLSHGRAGEIELEAERAAKTYGILDDYREALYFDRGRIARYLKRVSGTSRQLLNGRSACICGNCHKSGRPRLRRECRKLDWPCVVILEHQRRSAEAAFWSYYLKKGTTCCETMANCPLRKA